MDNTLYIILIMAFTFMGACIGSFINVVVYRLPKMIERGWLRECLNFLREYVIEQNQKSAINSNNENDNIEQDFSAINFTNPMHRDIAQLANKIDDELIGEEEKKGRFNLATPASHCPNCGQAIPFYRNIPLFTWLYQRGRSHCCQQSISPRYFFVELIATLLTFFALYTFGINLVGFFSVVFLLSLLTLSAIDLETQLLPDTITQPLLWLGLIINLFGIFVPISEAIYGAVVGYLVLWSLYQAHKLITKKEGMGFGDFKLSAVFGAWLGIKAIPLILFLAALIGIIIALASMRVRDNPRQQVISFGPALSIAAVIFLFFGDRLTTFVGY